MSYPFTKAVSEWIRSSMSSAGPLVCIKIVSVAKGSEEVKDVVMTYICVLLARITRSFTLQCFHKVHHWSYVK